MRSSTGSRKSAAAITTSATCAGSDALMLHTTAQADPAAEQCPASAVPSAWREHTFGDALEWACVRHGSREAIVWHEQRLSYAQFSARVRAFARGLIELGVERGEKVALWMADRPEWL